MGNVPLRHNFLSFHYVVKLPCLFPYFSTQRVHGTPVLWYYTIKLYYKSADDVNSSTPSVCILLNYLLSVISTQIHFFDFFYERITRICPRTLVIERIAAHFFNAI